MSIKHIFISHASEDSTIAIQLTEDLRNSGHETKVDAKELKLGSDLIRFINDSIVNAHTVIILYSKHTPAASWQSLEINSAVWNEVAQGGGTCIVVRLDDTDIPPILGPKVYGKLDSTQDSHTKLIEGLCKFISSSQSASAVIPEAFKATSGNPFRRLRAEYFEDRPDLHAITFALPDASMLGALEDMKPCFLEGSRGTGKSMMLLSLRARNYLSRPSTKIGTIKFFGTYNKLSRGAICNAGIQKYPNCDTTQLPNDTEMAQFNDIAAQEIIVCIIESIISEIDYCITQNLLKCGRQVEENLSSNIDNMLFPRDTKKASTFYSLLEKMMDIHRNIAEFIRRKFIYNEGFTVPTATFDIEILKRVFRVVKNLIPELKDSMYVVLLDEYENLFPYQQQIVNNFVKLGPPDFTVKIAKKIGGTEVSATTTGQEIQEIHDYNRLSLVYDLEDATHRKSYLEYLRKITMNILKSESLSIKNVNDLLPIDESNEVGQTDFINEVVNLCKMTHSEFQALSTEKRNEKIQYYQEAAIYRALYKPRGTHKEKRFAGFNQLAFISSGVVRYFQEILCIAYHLTYGASAPKSSDIIFSSENQSKSVHLVSQHNLTTLSRNVETYGEALKYFLLDIGDCLRHKLLQHTSEPEAARLTISDPVYLDNKEMEPLKRLLFLGIREGIFQTKEGLPAFKPKHRSDPQPIEFNICRIYAPVLEISPRLRWRTKIQCSNLLGLAIPEKRGKTLQQLKNDIVRSTSSEVQQLPHMDEAT